MTNEQKNKNAIIGTYKQYLIIEREALWELKDKARELINNSDNDTASYIKGQTINEIVKFIKEKNIYNEKELHYNKQFMKQRLTNGLVIGFVTIITITILIALFDAWTM